MPQRLSKKSYSERRAYVMKKLRVLERNKIYGEGAAEDIAYIRDRLPPESQIKTARERKMAFLTLERVEESDLYSVSGRRKIDKRRMEQLNQYGLNIKTVKDLDDFGTYMDALREYSVGRIFDSTKAAEMFGRRKTRHETIDDMIERYKEWEKVRNKRFTHRRKARKQKWK